MLDASPIYSLSDFLTDHKSHVTRLKETRMPEVLTVDGRAEVVILDAESYRMLMKRLHDMEAIAAIRAEIVRAKQGEPESVAGVTEEEWQRRTRVMEELTAETERLGLYR